jgi:2-polyprenyl-6-methoxyphenol hydroxylase-like FAD-dependent oxidoreductase
VTPFAGNGANLAITDAWDLATKLCESTSFSDAMEEFDELVIPRAKAVLDQSHLLAVAVHSQGWKFWIFTWVVWGINSLFGSKD